MGLLARAALTLGLPAAAFAAGGGASDPGYWNKRYPIPPRDRVYAARLSVRDARAAAAALSSWMASLGARRAEVSGASIARSGNPFQVRWPADNQLLWDLPAEAAERASRDLARFGRVESLEARGPDPIPDDGELSAKKQALASEAARAGASLRGLPGASGLLEEQLKSLDWLLARAEAARARSVVYVTLVDPRTDERRFAEPASLDDQFRAPGPPPAAFWTRLGVPDPCQGVPRPIQVVVQAEDVRAKERALRRMIEDRGGKALAFRCSPEHYWPLDRGGARFGYEVPARALEDLKSGIAARDADRVWQDESARSWRKSYADAAEKVRVLDGELRDPALARAPVLRGLVAAEAARLAPFARTQREFADAAVLDVFVLPAAAPK